jgi:hypothetical protein
MVALTPRRRRHRHPGGANGWLHTIAEPAEQAYRRLRRRSAAA